MVGESETRLKEAIDDWGERTTEVLKDHEQRMREIEDFQIGQKSSVDTAKLFFSFGRWVFATIIAICVLGIAVINVIGRSL